MESLGITSFDILVIIVIALSALYGLSRGFTQEILSLLAWVAAAVVTLYALPHVSPWLQQWIENESLADVTGTVLVGVIALILFKFLARWAGSTIKGSVLGPLDRLAGALFGLVRAVFILSLGYLVMSWMIPQKNMPDWIQDARTRSMLEYGASILASVTPAELIEELQEAATRGLDRPHDEAVKERGPKPVPTERTETERAETGPEREAVPGGYSPDERQNLESLIERHI